MLKEQVRQYIEAAVLSLIEEEKFKKNSMEVFPLMSVTKSKERKLGDYASNVALVLAKTVGLAPAKIALLIKEKIEKNHDFFAKVEVALVGFINFTLSYQALSQVIPHIVERGYDFGRSKPFIKKRALVEFVSANPTGGLHLGHARGAFVGDALARLLEAAGYEVTKEFYVNDTGKQIHSLAHTIHKRYRELFGQVITIEKGEYPGEYVKDIACLIKDADGDKWLDRPEEEWLDVFTKFGVDYNLSQIKGSLIAADIHMDEWFFEHTLHENGKLDEVVKAYEKRNMLYESDRAIGIDKKIRRQASKAAKYAHLQEGGIFLKTSELGDEEDRIIQRKDGSFVYLTADLAYHNEKFKRGFDLLIDVLGGDHAGHVARIKAGIAALGHDIAKIKFVVVQMVRLLKGGQEVKFSKRAGEVVGLDYLIDEVGKDAARFVFLMRSCNAQFDLDLDLLTEYSNDNPVFYVQYGHARMATILAKAKEQGISFDVKEFSKNHQQSLSLPEERELILRISELDEVVRDAAENLEPHRLIYFCSELIKTFHSYFTKYRHSEKIISMDEHKTEGRLAMVFAIKQAIFNALSFLGISAPKHMELAQK
jgi:arginyl-tRNA synthetase